MTQQTIRVFVHPHDGDKFIGRLNLMVPMLAVPRVGEYIIVESGGDWFRVDTVVHCPFNLQDDHPDGNPDVEVWATRCTELEVLTGRKPDRT